MVPAATKVDTADLHYQGNVYPLPVVEGTEGERGLDIQNLRRDSGLVTLDYVVTDAAVARWALSLPGDDDIDLYLFNSAGDLVGQSTNGGTDELIELQLPANDTYTLAVHGWAVAEPTGLAFAMQSWLVPLASETHCSSSESNSLPMDLRSEGL